MSEWLKQTVKEHFSTILLAIVSWSIGFATRFKTASQFNLDSPDKIHQHHLTFFFASLALIFLPFAKTIKVGNWIELAREVKETKEEMKAFKQEIRQTVSMLSNTVEASNRQQVQVNLTLPPTDKIVRGETGI